MSDQSIMEEMIRRISDLENKVKDNAVQKPRFEIVNANYPAQITSNQNDYNPGNYDFLYVQTDASRNLSGISGGVFGRRLSIYLYGSFNLVILNASGSSAAGNRFTTPTGANLTLTPPACIILNYTGSDWVFESYFT